MLNFLAIKNTSLFLFKIWFGTAMSGRFGDISIDQEWIQMSKSLTSLFCPFLLQNWENKGKTKRKAKFAAAIEHAATYTGCLLGLGTKVGCLLGLGTNFHVSWRCWVFLLCVSMNSVCVVGTVVLILGYDSAHISGRWVRCFQTLFIKILKVFFDMHIL